MSNLDSLVQLHDLGLKLSVCLEISSLDRLPDLILELVVLLRSVLRCREQIRDDAVELVNVFFYELGDIADRNSAQDCDIFILVRPLLTQSTRCQYDRLDSPHTVVVVTLSGELLRGQLQRLDNLDTQLASILESITVKLDLSNGLIVRDHHGDWAEESLEVVG